MTFSGLELSAIVKLGMLMSQADGHVDETENAVISLELIKFGVTMDAAKGIVIRAGVMEFSDAIPIVKAMTSEEKKHVVSFLGAVMAADGQITEDEKKICTLVSVLCGLPTITAADAILGFLE